MLRNRRRRCQESCLFDQTVHRATIRSEIRRLSARIPKQRQQIVRELLRHLSDELKHFLYNHLSFRVVFRKHLANDSAQIVGFEVTPYSINHEYEEFPHLRTCNKHTKDLILGSPGPPPQEVDADKGDNIHI
ncbi:hypothetical protein RHMOL_Rhmol12G0241300 [Rhododendron molle]|uniref:Uncharacterized protein n=1 Tax=Rhododendron molle TaxID=49168 RepID=A0ACC0LLI8_RHOML|nr:hypothetical protein RHMOL_Rhmol12G0241300 [Rhododendron molle]